MSEYIEYKFILIGNEGVGKTSIFRKLSTGEFNETNISTIGVEKKTFFINIKTKDKKDKNTKTILFDTAGQEKFRAVTKTYYKGSDGILLIYDITDKESFESVENWIKSINEQMGNSTDSKYAIFLIGNKLDLLNVDGGERVVSEEEAKGACDKFGMIWGKELSTKNIKFEEITKLFESFVQIIYDKFREKQNKNQQKKKLGKYKQKKGCCEKDV